MPAAIKIFPEQLSAQLQSLTTDMQKQHAVTSEPDCEESLGEMILVFPVVLSTCGVQNMGNYHAAAWRGRERPNAHSGRWKSWESPTAVQPTKPSEYFVFWSVGMETGVQTI